MSARHRTRTNPAGIPATDLVGEQHGEHGHHRRPGLLARLMVAAAAALAIVAAPAVALTDAGPAAVASAQPVLDAPWEGCGPGLREVPGTVQCTVIPATPHRPSWLSQVVMGALGATALVGLLIVG